MMMTWMEAPTPSEDHHKKKQYRERVAGYLQILRNERDDLKEKLDESRENTRNEKNKVNILESKLSAAESGIVEMKKILENKYRELVKNYYNKVQNLVEGRVRDEKAKLADRLSTAEAKVLQYAKVLGEKEVLEAMISQERQEKALLKQAKLELEKRYKDRDDEAKALREGYNQLSNDIQTLQTEKAVLQADYDGLKREQERLPEGNQSSSKPRHADQPAVSSPQFSATTAFDRQTAELQHLDGLVAIWQTTLDNATADRNESRNKKEALQTKIQEAKQQLEKLKPASPSKPHRRSDTKSTSKNIGTKEVEVKSAGQVVPQSSSSTSGTLLNTRILAEPFPALSSPTVLQTTPSNTWRTLRLIDVPKQQKPDTKKNSG
jgi:chromosome segregation ATPase